MKKIIEIKKCDICGKEVEDFYTSGTHEGRLVAYTVIKEVYYQGKFKMTCELCKDCYDKIQKALAKVLDDVPFTKIDN